MKFLPFLEVFSVLFNKEFTRAMGVFLDSAISHNFHKTREVAHGHLCWLRIPPLLPQNPGTQYQGLNLFSIECSSQTNSCFCLLG